MFHYSWKNKLKSGCIWCGFFRFFTWVLPNKNHCILRYMSGVSPWNKRNHTGSHIAQDIAPLFKRFPLLYTFCHCFVIFQNFYCHTASVTPQEICSDVIINCSIARQTCFCFIFCIWNSVTWHTPTPVDNKAKHVLLFLLWADNSQL